MIQVDSHPLLHARAFTTSYALSIGEIGSQLQPFLRKDADLSLERDEPLRVAIRELLRHGGYRPTGRGKPSSEYLVRAVEERELPSINVAVDACNAISLASGIPISVVDFDLLEPPLRVALAAPGDSYVFNAAGQSIELAGLLCLFDVGGPCANAVKDSQRTKTHAGTRRTLSILWGHREFGARVDRALQGYRELVERSPAKTEVIL